MDDLVVFVLWKYKIFFLSVWNNKHNLNLNLNLILINLQKEICD